jgi:putative transposase
MAKRKPTKPKPLGTVWRIRDELWAIIEPILSEFWPRRREGRPPANWRTPLEGIIFRMRSGCQWDRLPKAFGSKSTVHDWFQRWKEGWRHGKGSGDPGGELPGTRWLLLGMAKCGRHDGQGAFWEDCVGPNPADRAKNGTPSEA